MGLGAPRKRSKLSRDPNNTTWSRSATNYGQKILQSHGWIRGRPLGGSEALHSDLRSAASGFHIRVAIKDDNLGLGAKHDAARVGNGTTGLDIFQDLLGRLNGRSISGVEKDRLQRSSLRSSAYIEQRWGSLRFVSGGLLVGDKASELTKNIPLNESQQTPNHHPGRRTLPEANRPHEIRPYTSKRKKHKKRNNLGGDHSVRKTSKEFDCRPTNSESWKGPSVGSKQEPRTLPGDMGDQFHIEKVRKRDKKVESKLKCKANGEARYSSKLQEQPPVLPSPDLIQVLGSDIRESAILSGPSRETRTSHNNGGGGLSVRHRFIQQKKMCMRDHKALNEILMIKS